MFRYDLTQTMLKIYKAALILVVYTLSEPNIPLTQDFIVKTNPNPNPKPAWSLNKDWYL